MNRFPVLAGLAVLFLQLSCRNADRPLTLEDRLSRFLDHDAARPQLLRDHRELRDYLRDFPRGEYDLRTTGNGFSYHIEKAPRLDGIKQVVAAGGVWESYFIDLMAKHIKPGTAAVDVGAYIGTHSLAMSRLVGPEGRVYAFEPQRKVFRELVYNLIENDVQNVVPLRFALGEANRIIEMDKPVDGLEGLVKVGRGGDPVELRTLDSFHLKGVSFLKIDVEGYEEHVLEGARRTIAGNGNPPILTEGLGGRFYLEDYGYAVTPLEPRDFLALPAPPYELGATISFVDGGNAVQYKSGSWSYAEDWGTWTTGRHAHLVLPLREVPRHDLILAGVVKAHINDRNPRLEVKVFVNGRQVSRWLFRDGGLRHTDVRIPASGLRDYLIRPLIRLTFEIIDPVSPAELGLSGDRRSLGLGVRELTVREF
jgi:FkbM family methyltransferase